MKATLLIDATARRTNALIAALGSQAPRAIGAWLGLCLGLGCGETANVIDSAPEGGERAGSDAVREGAQSGSGSEGTSHEDEGLDGRGGDPADSAAGGSSGGASDAEDSAQTTDNTGDTMGGVVTWDPGECHVPAVASPSDPTAQQIWGMARDYCAALLEQDCLWPAVLGWRSLEGCSADEQLEACLGSVLEIHHAVVPPECDAAWREAIECGTQATFDAACEGARLDFPYGPTEACAAANDALLECVDENGPRGSVEGTYTSCFYGPGATADCDILCQVGEHYASLSCSGPEGVPMRCGCSINGIPLNEGSIIAGTPDPIYVSDCVDAARQAADGLCTSRIDCCFEYFDGRNQQCMCGAEPARAGYDSCEALANSVMGQLVDICPQYESNLLPTCWPPPC